MKPLKRFGSDVGAMRETAINPFVVSAEQEVVFKYKPRLFGNFETSEDFLYTLECLELAQEHDIVELHLNSCGGSAAALSTLLYAIDKCVGTVRCIYTGNAMSAATFPLFHCDEFELAPDVDFLFHEMIIDTYPTTSSDAAKQMEHTRIANERLIRDNYTGFFSEEEILELLAGDQKRMFAEEVLERFKKMQANTEAQEEPSTFPVISDARSGEELYQEFADNAEQAKAALKSYRNGYNFAKALTDVGASVEEIENNLQYIDASDWKDGYVSYLEEISDV